jgi:hypothetical protein
MRNGGRASGRASIRTEGPHRVGALELVTMRSSEARERIGVWSEAFARQTREHPFRSLAVALAAGFVLGGGLFTRAAMRVVGTGLRVGLRMAVMPLVTQSLVTLGEGLLTPRARVGVDRSFDAHSTANKRKPPHEAQ